MEKNYQWLGSLPRHFQSLGLLTKELKIKDHTDVQKQQDNFIWNKAIVQGIQGDTVMIDSRPPEWKQSRAPITVPGFLYGVQEEKLVTNRYTWVVLCFDWYIRLYNHYSACPFP